jgi:ribulose-5-phosphate 4-epimerase/fuculose-1-phosphate aldolase
MAAAIEDLVDANHILAAEGIVDGFGHVSVRHPADPARYLLSRNIAPEQVTADDILAFDLDSVPIDADGRQPYFERVIHGEIYKARPDVNSVINAHSPWVLSFAANRIPLKPVHNKAAFLGAGTPIFEMREQFGMTDMLLTAPEQGARWRRRWAGARSCCCAATATSPSGRRSRSRCSAPIMPNSMPACRRNR